MFDWTPHQVLCIGAQVILGDPDQSACSTYSPSTFFNLSQAMLQLGDYLGSPQIRSIQWASFQIWIQRAADLHIKEHFFYSVR